MNLKYLANLLGTKEIEIPEVDIKSLKKLRERLVVETDTIGKYSILVDNKKTQEDVKEFFKQFNIHNIRYHIKGKSIGLHHVDLYNSNMVEVNPFDIRISSNGRFLLDMKTDILVPIIDDEDLTNTTAIFDSINTGYGNKSIPSAYAREISRTQIESNKGALENYLNRDVINYFIEIIYARQDAKLYKQDTNNRKKLMFDALTNVVFKINNEKYIDGIMTINSLIKASELFNLYINYPLEEKQKMISDISEIYDGNITVEDFLKNYDIKEVFETRKEYQR